MVCEMHVTFSEGTNKLWSPLKWNATVPGLYCQPEEVQLNTWKEERHDGLCSPMGWQVFEFYRSDMVQKQRTWGQASLNSNRATGLPLPFESTDRKGKKKSILLVNHKMGLAISQSTEMVKICELCDWAAWFQQQWGQKHQTQEDSTQWKPKASGYTSLRCSSNSFLCASFTSHNTASTYRSVMGY